MVQPDRSWPNGTECGAEVTRRGAAVPVSLIEKADRGYAARLILDDLPGWEGAKIVEVAPCNGDAWIWSRRRCCLPARKGAHKTYLASICCSIQWLMLSW